MTASQYPPQFPGYPPQFPQQPVYPPQFPGYPPQGFPQQPPAAPQQLAQGSLDDFYNQPASGGSKALAFPIIGTRYIGAVERPITNGDVQQQTSPPAQGSVPQWYKDGRPKLTMRIPLQMQPLPEFPDGRATWFVKGADRDELARAMAEAGAPEGPPEHGAIIDITYTNDVASGAGMNPRKAKRIAYIRPNNTAPAAGTPASPAVQVGPVANGVNQSAPAAFQAQQQAVPAAPVVQPVTAEPSQAQLDLLAKLTAHKG